MGRDKLLKVDDSISFRARNKIIRFTVLHDRQFTVVNVGYKTSPSHQNTETASTDTMSPKIEENSIIF